MAKREVSPKSTPKKLTAKDLKTLKGGQAVVVDGDDSGSNIKYEIDGTKRKS